MTKKGKWEKVDEDCPKCQRPLETLAEWNEEEEVYYTNAERCPRCRWIVDFTSNAIKAKHY